jgi:hypothetical protein
MKQESIPLEGVIELFHSCLTVSKAFVLISFVALLSAGAPVSAIAQENTIDEQNGPDDEFQLPALRWVGIRRDVPTVGLWMEFYPDSMLLVNDVRSRYHALDYRITEDSIIATGDTVFRLRYELVLDRMLVYTPEGDVITMAPQSELGRPFVGNWVGLLSNEEFSEEITLRINADGTAGWLPVSGGDPHEGEWSRITRTFTFSWTADSTQWVGYHDPIGNALQFFTTVEGSGSAVFRKKYR